MSDLLDINSVVTEFENDKEGDRNIKELKNKARKRKGRGIENETNQRLTKRRRSNSWNSLDPCKQSHAIVFKPNEDLLPQKSVEGWVLFITGIHDEATEDDINEKFSEVGLVKSIRINLDRRTGYLKGYALIEYHLYYDALRAKDELNGAEFLGCKIEVDWCFLKGPNKVMRSLKNYI